MDMIQRPRANGWMKLYLFFLALSSAHAFTSTKSITRTAPSSSSYSASSKTPKLDPVSQRQRQQDLSTHHHGDRRQRISLSQQTALVQNHYDDEVNSSSLLSKLRNKAQTRLNFGGNKLLGGLRNRFQPNSRLETVPSSSQQKLKMKKKIPESMGYWSSNSTKESRRRRFKSSQSSVDAMSTAVSTLQTPPLPSPRSSRTMWVNVAATMLVSLLLRPSRVFAMGGGMGPSGPIVPMER